MHIAKVLGCEVLGYTKVLSTKTNLDRSDLLVMTCFGLGNCLRIPRPNKRKDPAFWFQGPGQGGFQESWFTGSLCLHGRVGPPTLSNSGKRLSLRAACSNDSRFTNCTGSYQHRPRGRSGFFRRIDVYQPKWQNIYIYIYIYIVTLKPLHVLMARNGKTLLHLFKIPAGRFSTSESKRVDTIQRD